MNDSFSEWLSQKPNFARNYEQKALLDIATKHRDAVDVSRHPDGIIIGQDNFDRLIVATVFSAIAIEAALNDFVLSHCLFIENKYLQEFFNDVVKKYMRTSTHDKIELVKKLWPEPIPDKVISDVRALFQIRNRIVHKTGLYIPANQSDDGRSVMTNRPLSQDDHNAMMRHPEIARDFLSAFWMPGDQSLTQFDGTNDKRGVEGN